MNRIKTNMVELSKLYKKPCEDWLSRFKNGVIDAHKAFVKYGEQYDWLYKNSPYDLIGWEIEHDCFDWARHSRAVAEHCPQHFDPDKFNWGDYSRAVAEHCPQHFDPNKFNWEDYSWAVAQYCPDKLDPNKFNWKDYSWAVAKYCPDKLDPNKFNWKKHTWAVEQCCPDKLILQPKK